MTHGDASASVRMFTLLAVLGMLHTQQREQWMWQNCTTKIQKWMLSIWLQVGQCNLYMVSGVCKCISNGGISDC